MTASRTARIADAWGIAPFLPAPHRAPAAGVGSLPASAAFSHFTESCPSGGSFRQDGTAPAVNPEPTHPAGAVPTSNCPASLADDDGHPSIPSSDVLAAGQGDTPGVFAKSEQAVSLSDHIMILVRAIAAYEQVTNERAIALALADYVIKIGAGPLARATLDEIERNSSHNLRERVHGGAGDVDACPAYDLAGDLHAVPEHIRRGQNRLRSGP
jgi:hypothetical protein